MVFLLLFFILFPWPFCNDDDNGGGSDSNSNNDNNNANSNVENNYDENCGCNGGGGNTNNNGDNSSSGRRRRRGGGGGVLLLLNHEAWSLSTIYRILSRCSLDSLSCINDPPSISHIITYLSSAIYSIKLTTSINFLDLKKLHIFFKFDLTILWS